MRTHYDRARDLAEPVPAGAKWTFTTRRVRRDDVAALSPAVARASAGDLVLAEVRTIGQHRRCQLAEGRYSDLYHGDRVVLACGDRYAPDQFEGIAELDPARCDMLAAGGIAGRMRRANARMASPTRLRPLGLLADAQGRVINVSRYALRPAPGLRAPLLIGVVGASMNAGKTTAAASLAHGFGRAGLHVAALKATGTGAFGDFNAYRDAGVPVVADFTDAGMASTYRQPLERIEDGLEALVAHAAAAGAEVAVVELADGVFQHETAALLARPSVRERFAGFLFAAGDALGVVGGVRFLRDLGVEPFAVSGMVSCSPLAASEATAACAVEILSREALCDPEVVAPLLASMQAGEAQAAAPTLGRAA